MGPIKKLTYIIVVISMIGLAVACATKPTPTTTPVELPPLKIGAIIPYTGPDPMAFEIDKGIKLKLDEVGWEVAGRKIDLITEDDAYDPTIAVQKAKKLVEVDNVEVILGALFLPCSLGVGNYLLASKIPQFTFVETPIDLFPAGSKNFFCLSGSQAGVTAPLGEYAYDKLGYRTATVMHQDFIAGEKLAQGFIDAFEAKGGKIVQIQKIPIGTMDYGPYVSAIKKADCEVCWLLPQETMRLLPVYFNSGIKMPFIQLHGSFSDEMLQGVGDSTIGMVSILRWNLLLDSPTNKNFVDNFVKTYQDNPRYLAASGYENTAIFLEAVKATGGNTKPEVINDAIRKVKIDLPSGITSFTEQGVGVGDLHILKVEKVNGKVMWTPIFTYSQLPYIAPSEIK